MGKKYFHRMIYPALLLTIALALFGAAQAATNPIDATNKWAWGTNAGWINFRPTHGGVTVYDDHLEGYAWGENIGWVRLGSYTGGSPHTYANAAADTYGVNNDGAGNLSGYAWGTNVGWINFNPSHGQVTIDPATGEFDGYAWGENVGWIHFKNTTGNAYNVTLASYSGGTIDTTNKWAWSTNTGWINFNPSHGGVTVYADHLEGTAWGENTGWISLGTTSGGSPYTYANDAATTYGVNNDGCGNLSGSAWGANVGWIDFDDANGGVTIDPVSGAFDGYAWGENIGWVRFRNTSGNAYNVAATTMGNLAYHQTDPAAIITSRSPGPASSSGLIIGDSGFLADSGDCIVFGHNNAAFANVNTNLPSGVDKRWARIWELDVNDGSGTAGGSVTLTFDISDAGGNAGVADFSPSGTYFLLKRAAGSNDDFTEVAVVGVSSVSGDQLTFTVDAAAANLGSEFTVGGMADSPTAVTLKNFKVKGAANLYLVGALVLAGLLTFIWFRRSFRKGLLERQNDFRVTIQNDFRVTIQVPGPLSPSLLE